MYRVPIEVLFSMSVKVFAWLFYCHDFKAVLVLVVTRNSINKVVVSNISDRISDLSTDKEIVTKLISAYRHPLMKAGYKFNKILNTHLKQAGNL